VQDLLTAIDIIEVDLAAAQKYGEIRAPLLDQGQDPGPMDLLNAAIALVHNMTVVTHNVADYAIIPGLTIDDWLVP
jgi:tRNA(fMet)-specific endonuclease VapC